jgi:hypothetical protein
MNKTENKMDTLVNSMVVVKFNNGRTISGVLRKEPNGSYTIKLGTKYLPIQPETTKRIVKLV